MERRYRITNAEGKCKHCGVAITYDGSGAWVDATDGDGCGENLTAGSAQPHGSHEPICPECNPPEGRK
jgi:hypothetical protein